MRKCGASTGLAAATQLLPAVRRKTTSSRNGISVRAGSWAELLGRQVTLLSPIFAASVSVSFCVIFWFQFIYLTSNIFVGFELGLLMKYI
jgi:hypothetical protein